MNSKTPMKQLTAIQLALAAVLALPLAAEDGKKEDKPPVETPKVETLKVGATVAEATALTSLDGKTQTFKDLRGKVVIVHFWSDRCPWEKHGDPVMRKLEDAYKDKAKDVVILGIASNQNELGDEPAKDADRSKCYGNLRDKIKEVGFTHTMYADHGNKLSDLFGARSTPHCFVIDRKGVLAYAGALDEGPKKGDEGRNYVRDAAEALLAGREVETKETKPYG